MNLQDYIVDVDQFSVEGVVFKDITPLLKDDTLNYTTLLMRGLLDKPMTIFIVGCEAARGFIFGSYLTKRMGTSFIPVRKKVNFHHQHQ